MHMRTPWVFSGTGRPSQGAASPGDRAILPPSPAISPAQWETVTPGVNFSISPSKERIKKLPSLDRVLPIVACASQGPGRQPPIKKGGLCPYGKHIGPAEFCRDGAGKRKARPWLQGLCAGLLVLLVAGGVRAQAVAIPDAHLRTSLRAAFGKTAGALVTPRELATVTELDLSAAGIRDLRGLEDARNLVALRLGNNAVQALAPLTGLAALRQVDLRDNQITDLAPLAGLGLEYLDIGGNQITDLAPLTGLPALREVRLGSNPVQDFSPLVPLVRTGLLVVWRPDTPSGSHTIRVDVDSPMLAAKTMFLLAPAQAAAEDYAAAATRGYIEVAVTDTALELALRTGQRVVVVDPVSGAPPPAAAQAVDIHAEALMEPQLAARAAQQAEAGGIPGFACYRTVEETYASAQALATDYPTLAEWSDVGDSWKKTQDSAEGYDLMVLRLTNEARAGAKPVLFITSVLHAREYAIAELTTPVCRAVGGRVRHGRRRHLAAGPP